MQIAFYKGTSAAYFGLYNRLVRWWTRGPYSHVEIVFSDGLSASSSFQDGGVRFKRIDYDARKWDMVALPQAEEQAVRQWFAAHVGEEYDVLGNAGFVIDALNDGKRRWFCSEAVAAALGIPEPWRFHPNSLASVLRFACSASPDVSTQTVQDATIKPLAEMRT